MHASEILQLFSTWFLKLLKLILSESANKVSDTVFLKRYISIVYCCTPRTVRGTEFAGFNSDSGQKASKCPELGAPKRMWIGFQVMQKSAQWCKWRKNSKLWYLVNICGLSQMQILVSYQKKHKVKFSEFLKKIICPSKMITNDFDSISLQRYQLSFSATLQGMMYVRHHNLQHLNYVRHRVYVRHNSSALFNALYRT